MTHFPRLFSPISLGSLEVANRVFMAPMGTDYADERHRVTDQLVAYHAARARGGFGLNIVEHTAVHPLGLTSPRMTACYADEQIAGLAQLAEAVHDAGGLIAVQIQHGGRQACETTIGQCCLAPSCIPSGRDRRTPLEMSDEQIWEAVAAFGDGARRCRQAGMDGVEVHMAHGYLGCSFLSPHLNRRDDDWGGDAVRRTRFAREVIADIRSKCGDDFPVWCRISADEFIEGGQTLQTMQEIAPLLEQYGYCALHVSAAIGETAYMASAPYYMAEGHLLPLAAGIKKTVSVPVIGVGNIRNPHFVEEAIAEKYCDAVALGRQALADPQWPRKARAGRRTEIIPCFLCNLGCQERSFSDGQVQCSGNPHTGREALWPDWPNGPHVLTPKNVLVIGGGPAGLQAALTAAQRGHRVELWERDEYLGGAFRLASVPPGKAVLAEWLKTMEELAVNAGVEIRITAEATVKTVCETAPDVVIAATGQRAMKLEEAGIRGQADYTAAQVLGKEVAVTGPVVIIGGDVTGIETADYLAERGEEVVVMEQGEHAAGSVPTVPRRLLLERVQKQGVRVETCCRVVEVAGGSVLAMRGDEQVCVEAGTVISAVGWTPRTELFHALQGRVEKLHLIGDARQGGHAQAAVYDGARIGREV